MTSFAALFPSPVVLDVLSILLTQPDHEYYQREISEKTGHSLAQVQYALERIETAGLISKVKSGNRLYYKAVRNHPAFEDLRKVLLKTVALGDVIREALEPLGKKVICAFVYGSIASGDEKPDSDIDLFILGNVSLKELANIVANLSQELQREVNPVTYTQAKFSALIKEKNRFALELLETPRIWLLGNEHDFTSMAETKTS